MTRKELVKALEKCFEEDEVIVVSDEKGGWDNIKLLGRINGNASIIFGGGSPFSDE